jgi:S1-C subfamily serine protease
MDNGDIVIEYVKPNSGCADAGILAGCQLISVDDRKVRGVKIMSRKSLHADMLY